MSRHVSRIYYRNSFFHLGHLNTILSNERIANKYNGICYAIVDDRQDNQCIADIKQDFDYLKVTHIQIISVKQYHSKILEYTVDLINKRKIYLYRCNIKETEPEKILGLIQCPNEHFQLRLNLGHTNSDPSIGYTGPYNGRLQLTFIFDYIIKVLDDLLGVTDIISTSLTEINDVKDQNISAFFSKSLRYHRLDTYHIIGFKYSKRGWDIIDEDNPFLLTFKGLKARHIPSDVLKAFYIHACQMGEINLKFLKNLLITYLSSYSVKTFGIIHPIKVVIDNWREKQTEYVPSRYRKPEIMYHPLSNILYIEKEDYGMGRKVNVGNKIYLTGGPTLQCNEIEMNESTKPVIHTELVTVAKHRQKYTTNWISSGWNVRPCLVRFVLYNWFYTGYNSLLEPDTVDGYIDHNVFRDLDVIYHITDHGFFMYDRNLSAKNSIPTFIQLINY